MATLALVCVAGVSGTFLARRLGAPLPQVRFIVTTPEALPDVLDEVDAVILAEHVQSAAAGVRSLAAPRPVAILSAAAMNPSGVMLAVDVVDELLQSLPAAESRSTDA